MKLISHRGNTIGTNIERENSPDYVFESSIEYDVEIDVWLVDNDWYLGHDKPIYKIEESFLANPKFWCHAKNLSALEAMLQNNAIHCFWHQTDDVILTSRGFLWTFPGKKLAKEKAIAVMPEMTKNWDISKAYGVCSDFVENYI
jgi:hypothetical protein